MSRYSLYSDSDIQVIDTSSNTTLHTIQDQVAAYKNIANATDVYTNPNLYKDPLLDSDYSPLIQTRVDDDIKSLIALEYGAFAVGAFLSMVFLVTIVFLKTDR